MSNDNQPTPKDKANYIAKNHSILWSKEKAKDRAINEARHWRSQCFTPATIQYWTDVIDEIEKIFL